MSSIFDFSFVEREHARLCSSDLNPGALHIQGLPSYLYRDGNTPVDVDCLRRGCGSRGSVVFDRSALKCRPEPRWNLLLDPFLWLIFSCDIRLSWMVCPIANAAAHVVVTIWLY